MIFRLDFRGRKSVWCNAAYCACWDDFFFVDKRNPIARVNLSSLQDWKLGNADSLRLNHAVAKRFGFAGNDAEPSSNRGWFFAKCRLCISNNPAKILNNLLPFNRNWQLRNINISINFTSLVRMIL